MNLYPIFSYRRLAALVLWLAPAAAALGVTDNVGTLGPVPVVRTIDHGSGLFLDTINFQAQAPNDRLIARANVNGVDFFSLPLFENVNDAEVLPSDGAINGYRLDAGPPGYHVHPQGLVQGASGAYTIELSAVAPAVIVMAAANLATDESGATADILVSLNVPADQAVNVPVALGMPNEGSINIPVLTFAAGETGPKTITVTGVADGVADGNQIYPMVLGPVTSADSGFNGFDPEDVTVTNIDLDGGLLVSALSNAVTELGTQATFTVRLTSAPAGEVRLPITASNTAEVTVAPGELVFLPADGTAERRITVTGVDDMLLDGDQAFTINLGPAISTDAAFAGVSAMVSGINRDDDMTPEIVVMPVSGLVTDEDGKTAKFSVQLSSVPAADVRIGLSLSHPAEAALSSTELVFTPANALSAQEVTLTGLADRTFDADIPYFVLFAPALSSDSAYAGLGAPSAVSAVNVNTDRQPIVQPQDSYGGCSVATAQTQAVQHMEWWLLLFALAGLARRQRNSA